jgi:hypothetical protein
MDRFPDFSQHCEAACIKLWGEPQLRTPKQLRWSSDDAYGSRTYDTGKRVWYDRGADRGGSTLELVAYSKGEPAKELRGREFIETWSEAHKLGLVPDPPPPRKTSGGKWPPIRARFPYHDENNVLLFEVVRFDTEDRNMRFRQRRPDGKGGWFGNLEGIRWVLYRLPQLIAAVKVGERVLLTEGERDVNTAVEHGYAATTMPGGVGKWRAEYDEFLRGADVVIVSDNDPPGQAHAAELAKRLSKVAARVRAIIFPQKDLTEWVEAGGTREQLDARIEQAPDYVPEEAPAAAEQPQAAPTNGIDDDAEIEKLARMPPLEYERSRKDAGKRLGISRLSLLDALVKAKRVYLKLDADDGKQGQGQPIEFPEPEPWPDEVKGTDLLDEIATAIRRHVVMSDRERDICALWAVYTYLVDCFLVSPRLAIRSPTPECGKTTLLSVLEHLVLKPLRTSSVTASVTFRVIAMCRPTILIDEGKNIADKTDLLEVLNDGHRCGGQTLRNVPIGDGYEPRAFATFAALAIALTGASLPSELHGRSLVIDMKRRLPGDKIEEIRVGRTAHLDVLARKTARWATDNAVRIADMEPAIPPGIYSREADNWKPLLAIADTAGGDWPQRARDAAAKSHAAADVDDASMVELLLADIRDVFAAEGSEKSATPVADMFAEKTDVEISSADLVKALVAIEGHPWAEMGKSRKPLSTDALAKRLRPLAIRPGNIGPKDARLRGYKLSQFEEAFSRYLPPEGDPGCTPAHQAANTGTSSISRLHTAEDGCATGKSQKPNNDGLVGGCASAGPLPLDHNGAGLSPATRRQLADLARARAELLRQGGAELDMGKLEAFLRDRVQAAGIDSDQVELEVAAITDMLLQ